jgi:hypothetical protein
MPERLTLSQKIFKITQACSAIPRNGIGENADLERPLFSYVKIEDVLAVVNPRHAGWPMDRVEIALALFEHSPQLPLIQNGNGVAA